MKNNTNTINEQMSILRLFALDELKNGRDFTEVNDLLKSVVFDRDYDKDINVDAIRYLAKAELGLHEYQIKK
jgi:hypothetical protein